MQIVKGILIVIYFIVCVATIILALIQSKEDAGLSSTITGTTTNNFFEKNKGNTKEGKQKKWTVIFGIILVVLCIALGPIYLI
jgi:preprotein translocase subunit SecG